MGHKKRVAVYARVSTRDQKERQTIQNQILALRTFSRERGFKICREYVDEGISGAKESRPMLDELMSDAAIGKFEIVLVWSFDRFARSTRQLLDALEKFRKFGVDFIAYQTRIDTSTAVGKMFFTFMAAIGEFEREMIRQRIKAGLDRARLKGKRLGRRPWKLSSKKQVFVLKSKGRNSSQIAAELNISRSYVSKIISKGRSLITSFVDDIFSGVIALRPVIG